MGILRIYFRPSLSKRRQDLTTKKLRHKGQSVLRAV